MGTNALGTGHDYLGALGLDLSAPFLSKLTADEVLSVCSLIRRILMMKFHPDKWGGAPEWEQMRIAELSTRINQTVNELEFRESEEDPRLIDELTEEARKPQKGKFAKLKDRVSALEAELSACVYRRNLWAIAQCTSVIKGEYSARVSALHLPECDILVKDAMEDLIRDTALRSRDWTIMERQHPANSFFIQVRHEAGKASIRKFSAERVDYDKKKGIPLQALSLIHI